MGVLRRMSPTFRRKSSRNVSVIEAEVDFTVERSPFLKAAETQHDEVPVLSRRELQVGELLGTGSFSRCFAVIGYKLCSNSSSKRSKQQQQQSSSYSSLFFTSDGSSSHLDPQEMMRVNLSKSAFDGAGNALYAMKSVRKELTKKPHQFRGAAADLIIESRYLAALDHKNILKLRGIAKGGSSAFIDGHDGYFMIVDRLEETLADRIQQWQQEPSPQDLLARQADYALQLGEALAYLHDRRILFRDLKPTNVGFKKDDPHTVQLFDFGLCRELPSNHEDCVDDEDCRFHMSRAGTYLYMAPEVIITKRYNAKADVYSWTFLFHEMISLERPFDEFCMAEHKEFVCEIGRRPSLTDLPSGVTLPACLQQLLRQAWEQDPSERLNMRQVCKLLAPIVEQDLLSSCGSPNVPPASSRVR